MTDIVSTEMPRPRNRLPWPFSEIQYGLQAPFDSLRFFRHHKGLLFACVVVHLTAVVAYFVAIAIWILPLLETYILSGASEAPKEWWMMLLTGAAQVTTFLIGILAYSFVAVPIVNVLASPLFDVVAQKTYQSVREQVETPFSFTYVLRSLAFEAFKLLLIALLAVILIASQFLALLAPFALIFSLWFFGWDHVDRTLGVLGLPLRTRLGFGIRHFVACLSLGVWMFIPFLSTLFAFTFASAGASVVARVHNR